MKLIRVSRESILSKLFDVTEADLRDKLTGQDLEDALKLLPTEEEQEWAKAFKSSAPELQRIQRKISVCLDAEVTTLDDNLVAYTYGGKAFEIAAPKNSFKISQALEKSKHDAFIELCAQGCVKADGVNVDARTSKLDVDEVQLLVKVANKFFFTIFLE